MKLQPALDEALEAKAVKFLKYVKPKNQESADAFLVSLEQTIDKSSTDLIQSMVVVLSSASQNITTAAMKMIRNLINLCSPAVRLALVKAALIPQVINTLNSLSLSFAEAVDIHIRLMIIINQSLWLATPDGLSKLEIEDDIEQQVIHETVLKQVIAPSEQYIWHLCVNHTSIVDGDQSKYFLFLLAGLLQISPFYKQTLEFVVVLPVILTIPSCLTLFEHDESISWFLCSMMYSQREWNEPGGEYRQMGTTVHRMLRMEGIEDVLEAKLRNDRNTFFGLRIVAKSIEWNKLLGMNLQHLGRNRPESAIISNCSSFSWTTNTVCACFLWALALLHGLVCRTDRDSLLPVSLDTRHPLLLLRHHSRTTHSAHLWKAMHMSMYG
ncbi:hypothetical protein BLNAU_10770 [Blattamonas nauphoetae]|uniref:Uncharacterized protein n=1 Tax=Blattamonas nauphoetae TaxID=2049346 RepID=A0ABQ9XQC7_9EUKA|nr:hypothetical protein BLNAU_10770 [Blattamonas nauphoetae]